MALPFLIMTSSAQEADDTNIVAEVTGRFQATQPSVVMSYDVTYALLHIRLMSVANATIQATEGTWRSLSNELIPACLIDFQVASPQTGEGNIRLFKRTVSLLRMPDLKLIVYAKQNDEFIKPFFGTGRRMKYNELYNFESAGLTYRRHDLLSGVVETNLPGMADLAKQSTEVGEVLRILYANYRGDPAVGNVMMNKVHFNVDGAVRAFTLKMKKSRTSVPVLSRRLVALYADIQPGKDGDSRNESFSMWCMPFREFSREMHDPELRKLGETSMECSMLPLSGEYALFLGALKCILTGVRIQPLDNSGCAQHIPNGPLTLL